MKPPLDKPVPYQIKVETNGMVFYVKIVEDLSPIDSSWFDFILGLRSMNLQSDLNSLLNMEGFDFGSGKDEEEVSFFYEIQYLGDLKRQGNGSQMDGGNKMERMISGQ